MRSSSSRPFSINCVALALRQGDQDAARRVIEERGADRAFPPARRERGVLVVANHNQVAAQTLREAADLLDRLAHGEVAAGVEAAVAQRADAVVENGLGALFLFLQQLLGHEAFGEEQARRHARYREKMRLRLEEAREIGAFEQRAPAFLGAVVCKKDFLVFHDAPSDFVYLTSNPTRSMVARSDCSVSAAHFA